MKINLLNLSIILCLSCNTQHYKLKSGLEGKALPPIELILNDSTTHLYTDSIAYGRCFAILYYSPYCPYCKSQIEDIVNNISMFKDIKLYLISPYSISEINAFCKEYKLNKFTNIILGQDFKSELTAYINPAGFPYTLIYNEKKRLKELLVGASDAKTIKKIILQ